MAGMMVAVSTESGITQPFIRPSEREDASNSRYFSGSCLAESLAVEGDDRVSSMT